FAENIVELPDVALLAVAWAQAAGLLRDDDGELTAGQFPDSWSKGLYATLTDLWLALLSVNSWDPVKGWQPVRDIAESLSSVYLMVLILLARQPDAAWIRLREIEHWLVERHPRWHGGVGGGRTNWAAPMVAGLLFQLKLVQCAHSSNGDLLIR